jgi:Ca-activated chloride channel family protein
MHFSNPQALWLLWLLPPLAALYVVAARRRRVALRAFADEFMIDRLVPPTSLGATWLRGAVLGTALLGILIAAAGPRWGYSWEEVHRRGVDIVVALDLSRSMLAQDAKPDRLTAAKREITDLIELLQGDRVALVAFAGTAYVQCPLTLDYGAFGLFLDQLDPDWVPVGGTDLAAAVRTSMGAFQEGDRAGRAVILITDGEDHSGELRAAAEEAHKDGVHVFVVGMGAPEGAPIPDGRGGFIKQGGKVVLSKLDEPALKELALTTDGTYVRSVAGDIDLRRIYLDDIKTRLEARDLSSSRRRRWEERFQWALLPALLLLVLESLTGTPRRLRSGSRARAAASLGAVALLTLTAVPAQAGVFSRDDPARLGHRAFVNGEHQAALDHWIEAQVDDPSDRRLDYNIGEAHYRLGRYAEAEQAFREASATDDTSLAADALYNAGNAAFQQGKYVDAIKVYDEALELRPEDEDALANRDLAQRKYEELLDQANDQEQNQDQEQEQEQDGQSDEQEQDTESTEEKRQEQQQGQGKSEQEQSQDSDEPKPGEGEDEQNSTAEDEDESGEPEKTTEEQIGGAAEAADIDRESEPPPGDPKSGAVAEETEWDESSEDEPAPVEGALSKEQAEALLDALKADQSNRRRQRTEREARRGRRAAGKDW